MTLSIQNENPYEAPVSRDADSGAALGRRSFLPQGRISLRAFWKKVTPFIVTLSICGIVAILDEVYNLTKIEAESRFEAYSHLGIALLLLINVFFTLIYGLAVVFPATVRRWHDHGKSGKYFLLTLIPWLGLAVLAWIFIKCGFCVGENSENKYGPVPEQ